MHQPSNASTSQSSSSANGTNRNSMDKAGGYAEAAFNPQLKDDLFCGDSFTFRCFTAITCYLILFGLGGLAVKVFDVYACFYYAVVPGVAIWAYFAQKFRRQAFMEQALYCALVALLLNLPLLAVLPIIRSGWALFARLVGVAFSFYPSTWTGTIGFIFWSFVDSFCLRAFLHEAIVYIVIRRMLPKRQVLDHRSLIVYGMAAAMTIASVEALREVCGIPAFVDSYEQMLGPHLEGSSPRLGLIFSYAANQAFYMFPMHAVSVLLMVSRLSRRKFTQDSVSCFQVLFYPVLLTGLPNFVGRLLRASARSYASRVFSRKLDPRQLDYGLLARLAASQALLQFAFFFVMCACLCVALYLARHWYLKLADVPPLDVHVLRRQGKINDPQFLLSWDDLGVEWAAGPQENEAQPLLDESSQEP